MRLTAAIAAVSLMAGTVLAEPLKEGAKAPDLELKVVQPGTAAPELKDAKTISLKAFQGKKNVVLFFYPKALTGGCTKESCGFRDVYDKFKALDTVVLGISTDTPQLQQQFIDKNNLNFPLLADDDKKVTEAFGALSPKGVASRYTFVIDKEGVVRKVYTKVAPDAHPPEVLKFVEENLSKK